MIAKSIRGSMVVVRWAIISTSCFLAMLLFENKNSIGCSAFQLPIVPLSKAPPPPPVGTPLRSLLASSTDPAGTFLLPSLFSSQQQQQPSSAARPISNNNNNNTNRGGLKRLASSMMTIVPGGNAAASSSTSTAITAPPPPPPRVSTMRGMKDMTTTEMVATSTAGTLLVIGLIYTLALNGEVTADTGAVSIEALEVVSYNVVDAALPMTASDVVSVAAGEAIAGVVGAATSFGISVSSRRLSWGSISGAAEQQQGSSNTSNSQQQQQQQQAVKVSDAVADGDFLLTNAAAYPLLAAIGLSPLLSAVTSTLLAIVPYGIVKVGARRREALRREDELLQTMLDQNQLRKRRQQVGWGPFRSSDGAATGGVLSKQQQQQARIDSVLGRTNLVPLAKAGSTTSNTKSNVVDPKTLTPVQEDKPNLDAVESVADILKWLQFSVLTSDFGGHLLWQGQELLPGVESAILGSVAGVSSQFYSDILYAVFQFGGTAKQEMVKSRSILDWINIYTAKTIYFAVLFGVYEAVQEPAKDVVAVLLSGGAEACYGSDDMRACIETYVLLNPPGASPEAQFRSFITAAVSFWNHYGLPGWSAIAGAQ